MAPASQPNGEKGSACSDCGAAFAADDFAARFVCPKCGHPQPKADADYFRAFGVPERFAQDRKELERRFYLISRALHPDRFRASGDPQLMERSLERMAFLNEAYRTLKSPEELRAYVLSRAGLSDRKLPPPTALAEEWFELQEAVMDDPTEAGEKISAFERGLAQRESDAQSALGLIEARADAAWASVAASAADEYPARNAALAELHAKTHELSYLRSLQRDVARMKAKFGVSA